MKQKLLALLLALTAALTAAGCTGKPEKTNESFMAMDTFMQLDVYGDKAAAGQIRERITALESLLSSTDADACIYRLNAAGSATVDEVTADVLAQSLALCESTDGALDITVYPLIKEWGFISKDYHVPAQERLDALLPLTNYRAVRQDGCSVTLPKGAEIDLGAVAKGYAADEAVKILDDSACKSAILNLGGTVVAYGGKTGGEPWKVGVANPQNSADYIGYVSVKDKIIATSGSYERCFEENGTVYSHIINPQTGVPVSNGIESVTIIADNGMRSDGLSTALFVMGLEKAQAYHRAHGGFDYVILTDDGKAHVTPGIADSFTLSDNSTYDVAVSN